MTKQLVEGSTTNNYVYGGDHQLISKNSIVYIGGVYENDGSTITKYYFIGGERVAMRKGSTLYFLTTDQLGGTGLVTSSSGAMVSRVRYYPYGGIRTQEGTLPTDKLFTGQQQETSDVYHYNARMSGTNRGRKRITCGGGRSRNPGTGPIPAASSSRVGGPTYNVPPPELLSRNG